jgi:ubiquitin carboxyl-terminal hydrolase 25/28
MISDKDKSSGSKAVETDLVKFSDADIQKHRVGGRLVTRREIERSKKCACQTPLVTDSQLTYIHLVLARLGELFFEMEFAENPAITPSLELAKLALVTSKDEEEDDANTSGSTKPRTVEASSSSASTDATLVEEAVATAHNHLLHKPGGPSGLSSAVPAPAQPSSILGKRPREADQLGDKTSEGGYPPKPRSPRRDGSPPPDKTMRVEEPLNDVEMLGQSQQMDEDADMDMDNASDEAVAPDSVGFSPGAEILDDEGPTQEMIENVPPPLEKAVPPPLPPRKTPVKTSESTMMFGE